MMDRMKQKFLECFHRVPRYVWVLLAILCVGVFFRTYHFHDWLQFKGDAFRDATLVSNIIDAGAESLPLLGPRAGGTMLRLGPIFYYFQSLSATVFQSLDAPVLAYHDLFFSILSIPLFFFFSRRYFSVGWSLGMAGMLSVSFLAIEYGRFAWNPNSTLFFTLLFSYALLRLYDTESEERKPWVWALVAGGALAIASQLHFSAFLGLPIVLILFVLWNSQRSRQVLTGSVLLAFFGSALLIYLPVFISEFFKHGENTRLFFSAISSKASSHGLFQNVYQTAHMFAKYTVRIMLGYVEPGKMLILLSGIFFGLGALANVFLLRSEVKNAKRHFLQYTLLLVVVYFFLYIPLAFKIDRPRFYLPFMMIPYLYLGYVAVFVKSTAPALRALYFLTVAGLALVLLGNVRATTEWFSDLRHSEQTKTSTGEQNSKGRSFFLTWGHYERVAQSIDETCEKQDTIYFSMAKSVAEYDHSIEYALLMRKRDWPVIETQSIPGGPQVCYYYIALPKDMLPQDIASIKQDAPIDVGNLLVIRLHPEGTQTELIKKNKVTVEREKEISLFEPEKITRYSRVYWGDVWYRLSH